MEFQRKSSSHSNVKLTNGRDRGKYLHNLQLYCIPPNENISLQEFEELAVERLKILKAVEAVSLRMVKHSKNYNEALRKEFSDLKKLGLLKGLFNIYHDLTDEIYDDRKRDHISHFILRLAYCRSEELRRWFIQQEIELFRYRFNQESDQSIRSFLLLNNLNYSPIPEDEKQILSEYLASSSRTSAITVENTSYYKILFEKVPDLVAKREIYIKNGYAYIAQTHLISIILSEFRQNLSQSLARAQRALPNLSEDIRIAAMLDGLSKRYLGEDYTNKPAANGEISVDMIDSLSHKSYPLCMQELHSALRQHHHLRHWGRMQYGLFLKGIGLSLEGALQFWRSELSRIMDGDKFEKQYAYNIRHSYGKEGKRSDYTPYSCVKIITSNAPAIGDYHGCPFRHMDSDMLRQRLQSLRITKETSDEICQMAKKGHYQVACGMVLKQTHKAEQDFAPQHPNHYFEESQKLINGKEQKQEVGTKVLVKQCGQSTSQRDTSMNSSSLNESMLSAEDIEQMSQDFDS